MVHSRAPPLDSELRKYLSGDAITLIDLRSLRAHARAWEGLDEKACRLILGYDAYLALPKTKPASVIGQ